MFEIKDFYRRFIRYDHVPATLAEWRSLPETYLATATNGRVFADPLGEFTAFRDGAPGLLSRRRASEEAGRALRRGRSGGAVQLHALRRPGRGGGGSLRAESVRGGRDLHRLSAQQEVPAFLQVDAPRHEGTCRSWAACATGCWPAFAPPARTAGSRPDRPRGAARPAGSGSSRRSAPR